MGEGRSAVDATSSARFGDEPAAADSLRAELATDAARLHTLSHYAVLRVANDATSDAIANAYDAVATALHPAKRTADTPIDVDAAYVVYARAFAALVFLTDDGHRRDYDVALVANNGVVTPLTEHSRVFGAESHADRAEAALKANDARAAELAAVIAVLNDPDMVGYLATLAVTYGARAPARTVDRVVERALEALEACAIRDPLFDRAFVARGRILRRAGREPEARFEYEKALRANANSADAKREIDASAAESIPPVPATASGSAGSGARRPWTRSWVYVAATVMTVALAIGFFAVNGVPTSRHRVHDLLVRAEVDNAMKHEGGFAVPAGAGVDASEHALDAMGIAGTKIVLEFLADPAKAAVGDTFANRTMRDCALGYLLRLADRVKVAAPPRAIAAHARLERGDAVAESEWPQLAQELTDWTAAAQSKGGLH